MILLSFLVFAIACLSLPVPPLAFALWLTSVILLVAGLASRGRRGVTTIVQQTTAAGPTPSPVVSPDGRYYWSGVGWLLLPHAASTSGTPTEQPVHPQGMSAINGGK